MPITMQDIKNLNGLESCSKPDNEVVVEYMVNRPGGLLFILSNILREENPLCQLRQVAMIYLIGLGHGKALRDIELLNESFSEKESI